MIRRTVFLLSILLSLVAPCSLPGQEMTDLCQSREPSFRPGEHLRYVVYYNRNFIWLKAGTIDFTITDQGSTYLVEVTGRTFESYDWFFKVNDLYRSTLDKKTMKPLHFLRDIQEGEYAIRNEIHFDWDRKVIHSSVQHNHSETLYYTYGLHGCVHDILSLTYNLRNIDTEILRKQGKVHAALMFDEKIYHIPIRYLELAKNKEIRNLGTFDLHKISPDLISGNVFNGDSNMVIWVTNDANKIPLMIESPIKVGSVKAILQSWAHLKEAWNPDLK